MRTILVIGADRGIGEALCVELQARGDAVVAACLKDSPALRALGVEVVSGVDVTSASAIAALASRLAGRRLDVLIHVAGVVFEAKLGHFDYDAITTEYAVNALGPLRVTEALLGSLGEGSKIAIITSRVGSLGENMSGGLYGYRMSKAAANMGAICLAHDLKPRGIAVMALHPGSVRTEMTRGLTNAAVGPLIEPIDAARGLLARIDELNLDATGSFRHANGAVLPW
ncbi:MAG: SDR family oxidoreductase [Gammaproteobacteria bacterium]|nr:SDR family oxidoreductase [Gammaproteobacteria bacterium]